MEKSIPSVGYAAFLNGVSLKQFVSALEQALRKSKAS
jgi:hypothetical protein